MTTEKEIGEMQLQAKNQQPPPKAKEREGRTPLYRFQREYGPAGTFQTYKFQTSNLQVCENTFLLF